MTIEALVLIYCDECSSEIETIEPIALAAAYERAWAFAEHLLRDTFTDEDGRHLCHRCRSIMEVQCVRCSREMEYGDCIETIDDGIWCLECHEEAALIEHGIDVETDE